MKTFLITRPNTEAKPTGDKLETMGHRVLYAPMLKIDPISFEIPHESRSLILTSKNGARFGLANIGDKDRAIFAVGEQTAAVARAMGFTNITVGPGTARKLVPLLLECGINQKREYAHLCGNEIAYNISAVLSDEGIDAVNTVTYQTLPNRSFNMAVEEAMNEGKVDSVLFYSPRTATIFEEAISETGHHDWLPQLDAYCLSPRVADELMGPWRSIKNAILPTEKALFGLFKE
jgi:uroporphyrinogen-III synthase